MVSKYQHNIYTFYLRKNKSKNKQKKVMKILSKWCPGFKEWKQNIKKNK